MNVTSVVLPKGYVHIDTTFKSFTQQGMDFAVVETPNKHLLVVADEDHRVAGCRKTKQSATRHSMQFVTATRRLCFGKRIHTVGAQFCFKQSCSFF